MKIISKYLTTNGFKYFKTNLNILFKQKYLTYFFQSSPLCCSFQRYSWLKTALKIQITFILINTVNKWIFCCFYLSKTATKMPIWTAHDRWYESTRHQRINNRLLNEWEREKVQLLAKTQLRNILTDASPIAILTRTTKAFCRAA